MAAAALGSYVSPKLTHCAITWIRCKPEVLRRRARCASFRTIALASGRQPRGPAACGALRGGRRSCAKVAAQGQQQNGDVDFSYDGFIRERGEKRSSKPKSAPGGAKYYSEWDDLEIDDGEGDRQERPSKSWRNDKLKKVGQRGRGTHGGQMPRGGESWGKSGGGQTRKRSPWRGESQSGRPGSRQRESLWRNGSHQDRYRNGYGNGHGRGNRDSNLRSGSGWGSVADHEDTPKLRDQIVGELVYGVAPVTSAFQASRREFNKLYIQEGLQHNKRKDETAVSNAVAKAKELNIELEYVSKHDLNMVVDNRPHQGLALDCGLLDYIPTASIDEVAKTEDSKRTVWLVLDEVMDPQNLGAIIRSACFLGAAGIIVSAKNSAPLSPAVSKVSSGVMEIFPIHSCVKLPQFLKDAREKGWMVVGASSTTGAIPCSQIKPTKPMLLVVGNEGYGLRTTVRQACAELVKIEGLFPSRNIEYELDSLNVSVATGILLHSLLSDPN